MQASIIALTLLSGANAYIQKASNGTAGGVAGNGTAAGGAGNGTAVGGAGNSSSGASGSKNSGSLASVGIAAGAVGVAALFL